MATMTNWHKLKVGFKVNPSEGVDFYFTSILGENEIMTCILSSFEFKRICEVGSDIAINMEDVSWFRLEWESCCE